MFYVLLLHRSEDDLCMHGTLSYYSTSDDLWIGSGHTYDVHVVRDGR